MQEFVLFFLINLIRILKYAVLLRVLLSWIQIDPGSVIVRVTYEITEPILRIFRNLLPRTGMIDFSSLIAFFALDLAQFGVLRLFAEL